MFTENQYPLNAISIFFCVTKFWIERYEFEPWPGECCIVRTTRININRININLNDYYNPVMDYYNPVIDYYNPVIDYYNLLLRFEPCLNLLGLILILLKY